MPKFQVQLNNRWIEKLPSRKATSYMILTTDKAKAIILDADTAEDIKRKYANIGVVNVTPAEEK